MKAKKMSRRNFMKNATVGSVALGTGSVLGISQDEKREFKGKMKPEKVVELLNLDITGEIDAILTYMRNAFVSDLCEASRELEEIGIDEMRHVEWLASLVTELGGIPTMEHHELSFGGNSNEDFLKRSIELEKMAIKQYNEHIKIIDHKEVVEVLSVIVWEENKHLKEFTEILEKLS
jgi:bacterioferritin